MKLSTIALAYTPLFLFMFLAIAYAWFGQQLFSTVLIPTILAAAVAEIVVWRLVRIDRNGAAEPANG